MNFIRSLLPLLLILAGVGLFFIFTDEQYTIFKTKLNQRAEYTTALNQYDELLKIRDSLQAQQASFTSENRTRLQKIVPDNVDNIRLFLDMQGIAARFRMGVANIRVGDSGVTGTTPAIGPSQGNTETITLSFNTTTNYENLILFLQELERSLRVVEIRSLSFVAGTTPNTYQVTIGLNTFWLKSPSAVVIN